MTRRVVAAFCMADRGHFQRLVPLISDLSRLGVQVHVFTGERFRSEVERAGGRFADLFAGRSVEEADSESWPIPVRYVSFAGRFADEVAAELLPLAPSLVLHDTFAVIGGVVARRLGIPHVNVCAGHNVAPGPFVEFLERHPRVRVSAGCRSAVEALRTRHQMPAASPFSYVTALSPHLNLCCEPPEFLAPAERAAFEPLAFYGSLPALETVRSGPTGASVFEAAAAQDLKLFVSFGTVVWDVRAAEALRALRALAASFARLGGVRAVISLGGVKLSAEDREALSQPGVSLRDYVDQWRTLQQADAFVTHHGLNSTHEAIFLGTPMISYPFGWDQPGLAAACQRFGVAIPLTERAMEEPRDEQVAAALARLRGGREQLRRALATAREWELAVIAARPAVLQRMLEL